MNPAHNSGNNILNTAGTSHMLHTNSHSHFQLHVVDTINLIATLISKDLGIHMFTGITMVKTSIGVVTNRSAGILLTPSVRTVVMVTRTLSVVELMPVLLNQVELLKTCLDHTGCHLMTVIKAHHSTSKVNKIYPKLSQLHIYLPPLEIYNTLTLLSVGQLQMGVCPKRTTKVPSLPRFNSLW